jgi:hypothetical protein
MEVKVKLWGAISEILPAFEGKEEVQVDFPGDKVKDLIYHLFSDIDPGRKGIIFDDKGKISSDLNIILNGKIVSESNRFNRHIRGGDFIELVLGSG